MTECKSISEFLDGNRFFLDSLTLQTAKDGLERGVSVKRTKNGFEFDAMCTGNACSVYIQTNDVSIASFHTHPVSPNQFDPSIDGTFSTADLLSALEQQNAATCVGVLDPIDNKPVLVCACLNPEKFRSFLMDFLGEEVM